VVTPYVHVVKKKIMSIDNDHFDCSLCGKTHVKDNNELPVNESLKKLKKVYSTSNYHQLVIQALKDFSNFQSSSNFHIKIEKIEKLDSIMQPLRDSTYNMEQKIKNHCDN
jgi:hypothetical protein